MSTIERARASGIEAFLPKVPKTPPVTPSITAPRPRWGNIRRKASHVTAPKSVPSKGSTPDPEVPGETVETRRHKSIRIAQARMVNLIRAYRLLGNLSSKNYALYPSEVAKMEESVRQLHDDTFSRFRRTGSNRKLEETFQFTPDRE